MRDRTHWNSTNIRPRDPVLLGLCSQTDLNEVIGRAREESGLPPVEEQSYLEEPAPQPQASGRPDLSIFKLPGT